MISTKPKKKIFTGTILLSGHPLLHPGGTICKHHPDDKSNRHRADQCQDPDNTGNHKRIGPETVARHLNADKDQKCTQCTHRDDGENLRRGKEEGKSNKDQAGIDVRSPGPCPVAVLPGKPPRTVTHREPPNGTDTRFMRPMVVENFLGGTS